ncbi:MAG TPA: uroporphyrinogen-III C-methyltransferase [Candidatus Competibacteraceae bacterium]|nr:uroporphyrinogen-III C-methyltransferase [Gammaproteobacteria bacterium]HPF57195.1 uroporphyrinogen-III C-methyltransferase [Candidatus Competibacteraceae bacterium]
MTDQKSDTDSIPTIPTLDKPAASSTAKTASSTPAVAPAPLATPAAAPTPTPKSGRGLAAFALLMALGAGGGSGYLWYLWQQEQATQTTRLDQAIKQAIAQRDPEFQALKTTVGELQALKGPIDQNKNAISQLRTGDQNLKEQLLSLTGDLQPLKNAIELQKGETEIAKSEIKLLRESHETHKNLAQQEKQALGAQIQEQETRLAQLNEHLKNLQLSHNGLADHLETVKLIASKGGDTNAFPLAEVDYLLRLADTKLKLEHNVDAARLALSAAQQQLKTVDEKRLAPVQTMLSEAIATLNGVRLPDINALAHKLVEMEKQIDGLPLKLDSGVPDIKNRVKPATTVTLSDDTERPWWDRTSEAIWHQFKDIVVIRHQRTEAPPLIAREDEFFLRQNLRLELESLRTALLRSNAQAFQDSYGQVRDWTENYFDTADPKVTAFLAELQALQAVQFNPYIPDLTGLRQSFQEFITQRQPIRTMRPASAGSSASKAASLPVEPGKPAAEPAESPAMNEETKP